LTSINQLQLSAFSNATQSGNIKTSTSNSEFKNVLDSILKVPESLEQIFTEASQKYGVPQKLLKAVAKAESNFNTKATSKKGAAGIMQLMPATAKSLGVDDPYDAKSNIMGGAKYLRENLEKYDGNVELTLAAYNAGSNNVSKYGGIPPFKETQEYVKKVMGYMEEGDESPALSGSSDTSQININYFSSPSSQESSQTSDFISALQSLMGQTDITDSDDSVSQKSNYLYLIELMKVRMQMASSSISELGSGSDNSIYNNL